MATVKIGFRPDLDGTYPLDLNFNFRDFHDIKKITGIRAAEVMDALEGGDLDIFVALASVALRRAGVKHDPDWLFDCPVGGIEIDFGDDEAVEVETPQTGSSEKQTSISEEPSGNGSKTVTTISPETFPQSGSGIPSPDNTASGPVTSGN